MFIYRYLRYSYIMVIMVNFKGKLLIFMILLIGLINFSSAYTFPQAYLDCSDGYFQDGDNCALSPAIQVSNVSLPEKVDAGKEFTVSLNLKSNAKNVILFDDISSSAFLTYSLNGSENDDNYDISFDDELEMTDSFINNNLGTTSYATAFKEEIFNKDRKWLDSWYRKQQLVPQEPYNFVNNSYSGLSSSFTTETQNYFSLPKTRKFMVNPLEEIIINFTFLMPNKQYLKDKNEIIITFSVPVCPQSIYTDQYDNNLEVPVECYYGEQADTIYSHIPIKQSDVSPKITTNVSSANESNLENRVDNLEKRVSLLEQFVNWLKSLFHT